MSSPATAEPSVTAQQAPASPAAPASQPAPAPADPENTDVSVSPAAVPTIDPTLAQVAQVTQQREGSSDARIGLSLKSAPAPLGVHRRGSNRFERQGKQRVAGEDCRSFAKFFVASRFAAAQIVIIKRR